uniref:Uncharacterized protein n=1 Tax=Meloidogyne enterolobii TaxID=390850 RepID=A0A6V7X524_MELEN|nr:unnamed protein product [Meloidogyne enterolobii]
MHNSIWSLINFHKSVLQMLLVIVVQDRYKGNKNNFTDKSKQLCKIDKINMFFESRRA